MEYTPDTSRYDKMTYRRCGASGLQLPEVSLGLWHNFGHVDDPDEGKKMILRAFDMGITHFDLANNYGPPPGSAEENFGKTLNRELAAYRDELIISTKAGYLMWEGPYGEWGSRKYLLASLDQSLQRMGLDYVDIFYSHRPDPDTPMEETLLAIDQAVRQGKALYAGISSYSTAQTRRAVEFFEELRTPFIVHQPRYSMFDRRIEPRLLPLLAEKGKGCVVFSPLEQGLLTNKYLEGIPDDSRAGKSWGALKQGQITEDKLKKVRRLNEIAAARDQSLAQMALVWVLRQPVVTSVIIGGSRVEQIEENVAALDNKHFSPGELDVIEEVLAMES
jgi:L-glyceraldehyde 3-phosphate reductase